MSMLDNAGGPSGVHVKNPFATYGKKTNQLINNPCCHRTSHILILKCTSGGLAGAYGGISFIFVSPPSLLLLLTAPTPYCL